MPGNTKRMRGTMEMKMERQAQTQEKQNLRILDYAKVGEGEKQLGEHIESTMSKDQGTNTKQITSRRK